MFKLQHKLKTFLLCIAALFCVGIGTLSAQAIRVGVAEPIGAVGDNQIGDLKKDVRSALTSAIVKARGFQVVDQARTDQIATERQRQGDRLNNPEVRKIDIRGVDYLLVSEINKNEIGDISIKCEIIHLETEVIAGSDSRTLAEDPQLSTNTGKSTIVNICEEMMVSILDQVNKNAPGRSSTTLNATLLGADEEDGYDPLSDEIRRTLLANRANAKWNSMGNNRELQINTAQVRFNERREFGMTVFRVSGRVQIILTDKVSGNKSQASFEVKDFSERNKELVRHRLMEQIKSGSNNIIRDLLANQVDEWDW